MNIVLILPPVRGLPFRFIGILASVLTVGRIARNAVGRTIIIPGECILTLTGSRTYLIITRSSMSEFIFGVLFCVLLFFAALKSKTITWNGIKR